MDILLLRTKHLDIWFNTLEIGLGVNLARQLKIFYIQLFLITFEINYSINRFQVEK